MMKRVSWLLVLVLFFPAFMFAQAETSNWYFGNNAGIRFNNNGSVSPLNDGQLNTFEGCATISDSFGDLLFYTDGINVYDRNHNLMQNGGGLHGDPSSTQSALIAPKPNDSNIFYIFTVDTATSENDPDYGLNYSVVDLSLNNGNGAVTQKNTNLLGDCSEKVAAVIKDCSDQSIWIVTLASQNGTNNPFDTYHAFELNSTGVVATAVKSTFPSLSIEDPRGYLKFSNDGKMMASASMSFGLHIFDFDALTGVVSNISQLGINGANNNAYGIEFSPNNQYLYTHASNVPSETVGHSSSLIQYDLLAPNIIASQVTLDQRSIYRGALQLGGNGKIYRTIALNYFTGTPYLGVINNPNAAGNEASYQHNAIFLGNNATQGLPPFIQSFFNKTDLIFRADGSSSSSLTVCQGEPFKLEAEDIPGATYNWQKDGNVFINPDNHILEIASAEEIDSGRYTLEILLPNPAECAINGVATIDVQKIPDSPTLTLVQCDVDAGNKSDGLTSFNLNEVTTGNDFRYTFYETEMDRDSNNAITDLINYRNTQPYGNTIYYMVVNTGNCKNFGELELVVNPNAIISLPENQLFTCDLNSNDDILTGTFNLSAFKELHYSNTPLAFFGSLQDVGLEQNQLASNLTSSNSAIYARLENEKGCLDILEIQLTVNPVPVVHLEDNYQICTDNPDLNINGPVGFDSYEWFKVDGNSVTSISSINQVSISDIGTYRLQVGYAYANNGTPTTCLNSTDFEVFPSNKAIIEDITVLDFSENNSVMINVTGDGEYEYSLDGVTFNDSNLFEFVAPGFTIVYVRDKKGCGTVKKEIAVLGYPKFFTPNGDGYNDNWSLIGFNPTDQINTSISIFDRYGKKVALINSDNGKWNGTFNSQPLPSSDYWFKAMLGDGRVYKGHFALKR